MERISKRALLDLFRSRIGGEPFILRCPGWRTVGNLGTTVMPDMVEQRTVAKVRSASIVFHRPDGRESYLYLESGDTYEQGEGFIRITHDGAPRSIEYYEPPTTE